MFKTIVNFRRDKGRLSVDSCLTREWNSTLVNAAATLREISEDAMKAAYEASPLTAGMSELVRAERGMKMRRAMDSAIDGPFVLDHEEPMDKELLLAWYRGRKQRKGRK